MPPPPRPLALAALTSLLLAAACGGPSPAPTAPAGAAGPAGTGTAAAGPAADGVPATNPAPPPAPAATAADPDVTLDASARADLARLQKMVEEKMRAKTGGSAAATDPKTLFADPGENAPPPNTDALFGMKWGDPVQAQMVRQEAQTPGGIEMYSRPTDRRSLAGLPLEEVFYVFESGGLSGLSIKFASAHRDQLATELEKIWNVPPTQGQAGSLRWTTPTLTAVMRALPPPHASSCTLNVFRLEPVGH